MAISDGLRVGPAAELSRRLETLRESAAFRAYLSVRERVLRMKELEADRRNGIYEPSDYWREELANFEYLLDASPLVVEKLRQHTYHLTGQWIYEYRSHRDEARYRFGRKRRALLEIGDPELLVPESPTLGGFGFEIDGQLYNVDTLKFYEVLLALKQGAVLSEFRNATERRLVWEIGAGWGGFAYQFKTLCPNVTYVITDFPEVFLFSAVYLMACFPEARFAFYGDEPADDLWRRWPEVDFIFIPNTFLDTITPERLDLTVNMVSFQEMTTEQVRSYVEHAYQLDCPYLYSLNRDRSAYNTQLTSVRTILEERYWPHEIEILPVDYPKMMNEEEEPVTNRNYRHVVGWRRLVV